MGIEDVIYEIQLKEYYHSQQEKERQGTIKKSKLATEYTKSLLRAEAKRLFESQVQKVVYTKYKTYL